MQLPADAAQGGDAEVHVDALIDRARTLLGNQQYQLIYQSYNFV